MSDPEKRVRDLLAKVNDPGSTEEEQRTSAVLAARIIREKGLDFGRAGAAQPQPSVGYASPSHRCPPCPTYAPSGIQEDEVTRRVAQADRAGYTRGRRDGVREGRALAFRNDPPAPPIFALDMPKSYDAPRFTSNDQSPMALYCPVCLERVG